MSTFCLLLHQICLFIPSIKLSYHFNIIFALTIEYYTMRNITSQIKDKLETHNLYDNFVKLSKSHVNVKSQDYTLEEAVELYKEIYEILVIAIDNGEIDNLPFARRNSINNQYQQLINHRNNPNQILNTIISLHDQVFLCGLLLPIKTPEDYKKEFLSIKQNRIEYSKFLKEIEKTKATIKQAESLGLSVKQIHNEVDINKDNVDTILEETQQIQSEVVKKETSIEDILTDIKEIEKELEAKKLNIETFNSNIEQYKSSIEELKVKAQQIISNETKINSLIDEAKSALQLSSSVGVSAAFSTMYDKANDKNILKGWIIGALGLIGVAIFITIWIAAGWWIDESNIITSTAGRVVAVGIAITGATFCSKQYIRQKNIIDDYAYKATLSKSIIAFTDKIKESNKQQVAEYLTKVLDEIHKDPLRKRGEDKDDEAINMEVIEKFTKAISNLYPKK